MTRLTFIGDVFLKRPVRIDADLGEHVVLNLEAPLTRTGEPAPGKINLRADPDNFEATFPTAPRAACLANNHVMDFGAEGLGDTLGCLERHAVTAFGAGTAAENCRNPVVIDVDGVQVGLMGYVGPVNGIVAEGDRAGAAPLEPDSIVADMERARRLGAERVVVQLHWGEEQVGLPAPNDVRTARMLVDRGADLVVGHHAHCIQAFETYRDRYIFYGLGNAIFPPHESPSYFGADGRPGKVHVSRSFRWNKTSLAVRWDPYLGAVDVTPLRFDGASLRVGTFETATYRTVIDLDDRYADRYKRAYRWGKLRHAVAGYLAEPKVPRVRHVRGLARLLR